MFIDVFIEKGGGEMNFPSWVLGDEATLSLGGLGR